MMDVSDDTSFFINIHKNTENKSTRMGNPKKIFTYKWNRCFQNLAKNVNIRVSSCPDP
jgi:hypothetical protein